MKKLIRILSIGVLGSCCSCANFFRPVDTQLAPPPAPVAETKVVPPAPKRELGSLWTEESRWNDFYSHKKERAVGDIIILHPSDAFRLSVAQQAGHQGVEISSADRQNAYVIAKVTSVLPQGVYALAAAQSLKIGVRNHDIKFEGKLRESDIAPDDSSSTDMVFESNLKVEAEKGKPKENIEEPRMVSASNPGSILLPKRPDPAPEKKPSSSESEK
jgi:flagellar basal body L-ring protein FlgH